MTTLQDGSSGRRSGSSTRTYAHVKGPQEYANLVAAHARQAAGDSLYPGLNYENLAQYLLQPYQPRSFQEPATIKSQAGADVTFAVLYDLGARIPDRVHRYSSPQSFESLQHLGASETGHLLFLRGNPSPEWLNVIGYKCNVDPEYFLRHLDFRSTVAKPDYFNLPSLPSSNGNFLRLHWTTIGSRGAKFERNGHDQKEIELLRDEGARTMAQYLDDTSSDRRMKVCDSFVRRFAVHDETHFSFEQDVSVCVNQIGKSWIAIVWQDVGNDLTEGPSGPWLTSQRAYSWTTRALPIVQYKPNMALEARMTPVRTVSEGHPPRKFTQSASLLYLNYGKNLDQDLLASNPFYALTDLLKFTAFSEVQFLNMMETKLMKETNFSVINPRHSPTLSNLLYSKNLLDQHVQHIDGTISFIKTHLESKSDDDTSDMVEEASAAATSLLEDFEYLSNRAKALSLHCDRGMNIVMNNNMLLESQRAMEQAAGVAKLTRLAFFYIPLSFTASFFGMNFKQLGTGVLSIWVWFAASLPVFLISILFLAVDIMWYLRALWSSIKSIFSKKRV